LPTLLLDSVFLTVNSIKNLEGGYRLMPQEAPAGVVQTAGPRTSLVTKALTQATIGFNALLLMLWAVPAFAQENAAAEVAPAKEPAKNLVIEAVKHAGPLSKAVLFLLVASLVLAIAVIIERTIVFRRVKRSTDAALAQLDSWAKNDQWQTARERIVQSNRTQSPLFSVLRAGIVYWQELTSFGETRLEVLEAMVHDAVTRELKLVRAMLRANLSILANISSVAPFIGLFGTVVGIIMTFQMISNEGNMGPDIVSSGIADALIATAMGLFAAIPAVIAYNYFVDRITTLLLSMEEVALERIYFLVQRDQLNEAAARVSGGQPNPVTPPKPVAPAAAAAPVPVVPAPTAPKPAPAAAPPAAKPASNPASSAAPANPKPTGGPAAPPPPPSVTKQRPDNPSAPKFTGTPGKE